MLPPEKATLPSATPNALTTSSPTPTPLIEKVEIYISRATEQERLGAPFAGDLLGNRRRALFDPLED